MVGPPTNGPNPLPVVVSTITKQDHQQEALSTPHQLGEAITTKMVEAVTTA